ncbi:MAG: peptide chain release factor N(5)-glutamine methyltransferase [Prevotella sp.]|nr:peptide chain release factor N(5)-glutamine methyltransferase [Prevotella sp.]
MTYRELWQQLTQLYDEGEAKAIARMVYEVRYGLSLSDIYIGKDTQLSADNQAELEEIAKRLAEGEPVQYVLGQVDFAGHTFLVTPQVLIPRPETAELVEWVSLTANRQRPITQMLDIGTGSGCIAISLAARFPQASVTAWDISAEALAVARENAKRTRVHVSFEQVDILHLTSFHQTAGAFDLIVSNPPYICNKEREDMERNVLHYEPHRALFVPDDNPLLFYRAIADYAQTALTSGGWLYFEMNPLYAGELKELLGRMSYHDIELSTDQFGKQRFMRAQR